MNRKLLKRFLSDNRVSIPAIFDGGYLGRVFELLPDLKPAWNDFLDEVRSVGEDAWLDTWFKTKDDFVDYLKSNQEYQNFVKGDMSSWVIGKCNIPGKSVFDEPSDGCMFLSIDLKAANFQALRRVGVYDCQEYTDLISQFTSSNHLKNSKYFRSVVYGNLNVGRISTVKKYMTNEIRLWLNDRLPSNYVLYSMLPDELVYQISGDFKSDKGLPEYIFKETGIEVRTQTFRLNHLYLQGNDNPERKIKFFEKVDLVSGEETLHGLGSPYYLIGLALWKGKKVSAWDKTYLNQEGYQCKILSEFKIKRGI